MPAAPLLSSDDVEDALRTLPSWERDGDALVRQLTFADFKQAVVFVNRLVAPADEQNHHPDVAIHWNEVTLRLWTHASGGITARDITLARTIDEMTED